MHSSFFHQKIGQISWHPLRFSLMMDTPSHMRNDHDSLMISMCISPIPQIDNYLSKHVMEKSQKWLMFGNSPFPIKRTDKKNNHLSFIFGSRWLFFLPIRRMVKFLDSCLFYAWEVIIIIFKNGEFVNISHVWLISSCVWLNRCWSGAGKMNIEITKNV